MLAGMTVARWSWLGDRLALDVANTVRRRGWRYTELITSPVDLREWLARERGRLHRPSDRPRRRHHRPMRRARLRPALPARTPEPAMVQPPLRHPRPLPAPRRAKRRPPIPAEPVTGQGTLRTGRSGVPASAGLSRPGWCRLER